MTPQVPPARREGFFSRIPYHIVLLPICFTLAPFASNRFEAEPGGVAAAMLCFVAAALLLLVLLRPLFRTWRRAGAAATIVTFYLLYEPSLLFPLEPGNSASLSIFAAATVALLIVLMRLWRSRSSLANLTLILNIIVLVIPLPDLWVLANWYVKDHGSAVAASDVFPDLPASTAVATDQKAQPDIWYLIPDRYANAANIKTYYGFDNAAFIDTLRAKGFTVVDKAHANYQRTAVSMASVLNLDYLDAFDRFPDIDGRDWHPLYHTLTDNRLSRFLDRAGYRIHRFGSHWEPTRRDPYADDHHNVFDMPEFTQRVLIATVPGQLAYATGWGGIDGWYAHCQRLTRQYDDLVDLAGRDEQKYVLAHLLVTHPPFALTKDGRCLSHIEAVGRTATEDYVESVQFANAQFNRLIDAILAGPRPAVIVLMADEGPWPQDIKVQRAATFASSESVDWTTLTPPQLDLKTGILMAIHLPQGTPENGPPDDSFPQSPVNVFRLVLRRYFGLDLPPLPDRYFIYHGDDRIYDFVDVTARLPR